jgi:hypothetical protein
VEKRVHVCISLADRNIFVVDELGIVRNFVNEEL